MNAAIANVRPVVEILYLLSGILLLVGLAITYGQLQALKEDSRERSIRSSKEKAIEAANAFVNRAIPKSNDAWDVLKKSKVSDGLKGSGPDFQVGLKGLEWFIDPDNKKAISASGPVCNELEAVAAYFSTSVADEKTGFSIFGRAFCSMVENYYVLISAARIKQVHPSFQSIVYIYNLWSPRIVAGELDQKIAAMKSEIEALASSAKAVR